MKNIYISGPMSAGGYDDHNKAAFDDAERQLSAAGYVGVNPASVVGPTSWEGFMRSDLILLLEHADGVATLPEWKESRGANIEVNLAHALGIPVMPLKRWIKSSGK